MFKVDAAKNAGYSDAEIANYLAQQNKFNIAEAKKSGYTDQEISDFLSLGREVTFGEALGRAAERTSTALIRGGAELIKKAGVDVGATESVPTPDYGDPLDWMNGSPLSAESQRTSLADTTKKQLTDAERQQEYVVGLRNQTTASVIGAVAGAVADPTNLVGIGAKTVTKGALNLGLFGAATGAVEPVYEEFGDSRLTNVALGGTVGAVLGGGVGYLAQKAAKSSAQVDVDTGPAPKTREEIEAELPKLEPTESLPSLLAKAPEADQKYVDSILSRYEDDDPIPVAVLRQTAETVTDNKLAALFRGAADTIEATDSDKQITKALQQQEAALTSAAVDAAPSRALSVDALSTAERTGDYRDYLTTSAIRMADIRPEQFKRMVDPSNPFSGQNVKVLVTKNMEDTDVLEQIYGALEGRLKYERQTGKTFKEISEDAVPEEVALDALINRKVEELLPPEVLSSATKATARAINELHNGRELARVAKELGSDEAYAVLQSQMSRAASLLASLEGNSSNLGRALAYQKELKKLVDANKQLPNYLGGFKC